MEFTKEELGLILAALDWYEIAVERDQVDRDNVKARCDALSMRIIPVFFATES